MLRSSRDDTKSERSSTDLDKTKALHLLLSKPPELLTREKLDSLIDASLQYLHLPEDLGWYSVAEPGRPDVLRWITDCVLQARPTAIQSMVFYAHIHGSYLSDMLPVLTSLTRLTVTNMLTDSSQSILTNIGRHLLHLQELYLPGCAAVGESILSIVPGSSSSSPGSCSSYPGSFNSNPGSSANNPGSSDSNPRSVSSSGSDNNHPGCRDLQVLGFEKLETPEHILQLVRGLPKLKRLESVIPFGIYRQMFMSTDYTDFLRRQTTIILSNGCLLQIQPKEYNMEAFCSQILKLDVLLSEYWHSSTYPCLQLFTNLKSLTFHFYHAIPQAAPIMHNSLVPFLRNHGDQLTFLWIYGVQILASDIHTIVAHCNQVEELHLVSETAKEQSVRQPDNDSQQEKPPALKHLKKLYLDSITCSQGDADALRVLLLSPNLENVDILECTAFNDDLVTSMECDMSYPSLRCLNICFCNDLSTESIRKIINKVSQELRTLRIKNCRQILDAESEALQSYCSDRGMSTDISVEVNNLY